MKRIDENHSFNINVCRILKGHIQKAILLKEIYGWCSINKAKNHNVKFNLAWTYMSSTGFEEKFPYMTSSSIRRWTKELEKEGWIFSAILNKKGFDKTKWYTINFERYDDSVVQIEHTIDQIEQWKDQIEQCMSQIEQPIPSTSTTSSASTSTNINCAKANDTISEIEILKKELSSLKTELEKASKKVPQKKVSESHTFPDITPQKQYKVKRFNPCLTSATGGKEINKKWKTIEALKEDYESSRGIEIDPGLVEAGKKSFIETGFNYHKGINTLNKLEDCLFRWIDKQKKGLNQEEKPTSSSDVFCTYSPELDAQLRKEFEEMYGINKPQNNES